MTVQTPLFFPTLRQSYYFLFVFRFVLEAGWGPALLPLPMTGCLPASSSVGLFSSFLPLPSFHSSSCSLVGTQYSRVDCDSDVGLRGCGSAVFLSDKRSRLPSGYLSISRSAEGLGAKSNCPPVPCVLRTRRTTQREIQHIFRACSPHAMQATDATREASEAFSSSSSSPHLYFLLYFLYAALTRS